MYACIRTWRALQRSAQLVPAALLIGIGVAEAAGSSPAPLTDYATDVGEARVVALADGSRVHLNTQTHIRVHFERDLREVVLLEGEALFDVAPHDVSPFRMRAGPLIVRADGVRFQARRRSSETTVAVVEGKVSVEPAEWHEEKSGDARFARLQVQAGEAMRWPLGPGAAVPAIQQLNNTEQLRWLAWTQGCLWFEGESLAEVAREVNRYNTKRLVVAEGTVGQTAIGGVFRPTDLPSLLRALKSLGIRAEEVEPFRGQAHTIRLTRNPASR